MFSDYIQYQMNRVRNCAKTQMLSEKVTSELEAMLQRTTNFITKSTVDNLIALEMVQNDDSIWEMPQLLSDEERKQTLEEIKRKIDSGDTILPNPLINTLNMQLEARTSAFIEMIRRLDAEKVRISNKLGLSGVYRKIVDIKLSSGDTHNNGRSVAIVTTDTGKIVYKPHDMRIDVCAYKLAREFFPDCVGIAPSIAFDKDYGISKFIEKERANGQKEARDFWYKMGGLSVFIKIMGSTDMHLENITCSEGKPYILDVETVFTPRFKVDNAIVNPEKQKLIEHSIMRASFLPGRNQYREASVLVSTGEDGCSPLVDGKPTTVLSYLDEYFTGYDETYRKVLADKEKIKKAISDIPSDIPVRTVIRNTRGYMTTIKKLYHHSALENAEKNEESKFILDQILERGITKEYKAAVPYEKCQILRGDVPYLYALTGDTALYSDGEIIERDVFDTSPKENALGIVDYICEDDVKFDLACLERCLKQYPAEIQGDIHVIIPNRTKMALPQDIAKCEAKRLLGQIYSLRIEAMNGHTYWGAIRTDNSGFNLCGTALSTGLTGMGIFALAYQYVASDANLGYIADKIYDEMLHELNMYQMYDQLNKDKYVPGLQLGLYSGVAGILNGLSLIRRYRKEQEAELKMYQDRTIDIIKSLDISMFTATDMVDGIAGLIFVLCRFDEYKTEKELIKALADRLIELKYFEHSGKILWKTIKNSTRPVSGAGHGMAGIAKALLAAATTLDDDKYIICAEQALEYEQMVYDKYHDKYGTWADLRPSSYGGYMNGYCNGAPGIGIMMEHIKRNGEYQSDLVCKLSKEARISVDGLFLNDRDGLCCGNSAIAEYYITVGDMEAAGRVLGAMYERKEKEGEYRYMKYNYVNSLVPSIMYGMSGVGYEMLRYAFPEKIIGLL